MLGTDASNDISTRAEEKVEIIAQRTMPDLIRDILLLRWFAFMFETVGVRKDFIKEYIVTPEDLYADPLKVMHDILVPSELDHNMLPRFFYLERKWWMFHNRHWIEAGGMDTALNLWVKIVMKRHDGKLTSGKCVKEWGSSLCWGEWGSKLGYDSNAPMLYLSFMVSVRDGVWERIDSMSRFLPRYCSIDSTVRSK